MTCQHFSHSNYSFLFILNDLTWWNWTASTCVVTLVAVTFSLAQTHIRRPFSGMLRWVSFCPSRSQLPSVFRSGSMHQMTAKMFPLSVLRSSLLPFAFSLCLSYCLTLFCTVCLESCHSLIFQPLDTSMSVTNERGWITGLAASFIEICLGCNARSWPWKCFSITHTGTRTFACESKQEGIWCARQLVCPSVCVCVCASGCV